MKIKQLQLHNFKFFTDEDNTLNFNSKNVLIWGENGSGKSSIYWAIYTLLQCSYKDQAGIDAYFTENHEKNLLNIHKPTGDNAYIQMELDNGDIYKVALGEDSIVGNQDIQLSAISSDFIDYNVVASFLRFMHQHEPDQLALFEEQIFGFMPFNAPAPFTFKYFDKAIEKLREGLEKNKTSKKFPSRGSTIYDQYKSLTDEFNRQLRQELGTITKADGTKQEALNNEDGTFKIQLDANGDYTIVGKKSNYMSNIEKISTKGLSRSTTLYVKLELVIQNAQGKSIILNNISFATASANINSSSNGDLNKLVQFLKDNPDTRLEIQGHTDNVGNLQSNINLSDQRAKAVVTYLIGKGIFETHLEAKGYGPNNPIASYKTSNGKAKNRRVEMKLIQ